MDQKIVDMTPLRGAQNFCFSPAYKVQSLSTRAFQKSHFKKTQGAFSQRAPYIWNSLPICVRAETDISMFKSALKTHYYEQAFG